MFMLEGPWLSSGEPEKMLGFLEDKASKRKIALFRCASVRRLVSLTRDEERELLDDSERLAETLTGRASRFDLFLPLVEFWGKRFEPLTGFNGEGERWARSKLLRDIFGPLPFRSVSLDPAWLTWHDGLVISMSSRMYDARDFSDMPVLADALEEAGCQNQDILIHCRSRCEHVRGCWVVDLVLGKS